MLINKIEVVTVKNRKIDNFALARNNVLKKTKSEWVFFVDSDESITQALKNELSNLDTKGFSAFWVRRKNYFLGMYVGQDIIIRLGRKDAGRWRRKVHETWEVKGRVGVVRNYLVHDTADELSLYIDKLNHYSDIHASANESEGKKSNVIKIIFYPFAKFWLTLIKTGNVVFSIMQSLHSFLSWSKQYFLYS